MSINAQTVATLREGDTVEAVFACVRKERLMARSGTAYLTLELRDQSGSVTGRVFRDADLLAGRFERGDLVRVGGRATGFIRRRPCAGLRTSDRLPRRPPRPLPHAP